MDPLAALLNYEDTENDDVQPEKKQKEKKKRMSLAMLKRAQAKMAEEARQQLLKQRQENLRETKKRVQQEWQINQAKCQAYVNEFETRLEQLQYSYDRLSEIDVTWNEHLKEQRINQEWLQYLTCGGLPDPSSVSQMNSYIFVWTEIETFDQMPYCIKKTEEVMKLLNSLQKIIDDPGPNRPPKLLEDMKELRNELRNLLQEHIDRATFALFSRIETDMVPINVTTSKYFAKCPYFQMNLWAELITPIPSSKERDIRNPLKVVFEEAEITAIVPVGLLDVHKIMRAMWLNYDHWSDRCRTYDCPPLPNFYKQNLFELFISQYETKTEIVNYRNELEIKMKKRIAAIPPEPTISQEILAWDSEPQKTLSQEIFFRECEEEDNLGRQVKEILNEFEVNLRESVFLGDLLLLEVFHQPPQPKYLRFKHSVTLREEPPKLHHVNYYVKYPPPGPEELESEVEEDDENKKAQESLPKINLEEEIKKLVVIKLKPCQSVLWFEKPKVANWDPIHEYWSTEDIHDITYQEADETEGQEQEESITFKTSGLGLMGLHVYRYCHFPYQDWIFEANDEGGVNFYLKTSKTELNFKIKESEVSLESMNEVPGKAMNWILGVYYSPSKLMEFMRKGGIDVFPAFDAASYIENIQSKHVVIENNIYQVWGLFGHSFRFKRSKFNQLASRENIVFQAQEIYKNHQVDFCLLQTSMCASYVLDIAENSEKYSPEPAPGMKTYIDLYSLLHQNCTREARKQSDGMSYLLVQTIREFMSFIRPISFS